MRLIILKTWVLRVIKAVFFDWFHTLAQFEPPQSQLYSQTFREFGIELPLDKVRRGVLLADQYYFEENAKSPVTERSPEEQARVYIHYPNAILAEAGANAPAELPLKILKRVRELFKGETFGLFDDVLPNLKTLKQQNFILGLLTNLDTDVASICRKLGLDPYLDFVVTSKEAGADKPNPPIFLAALDRAGVNASEAVHVGDQYRFDVIGARGVGIKPVLIVRRCIGLSLGLNNHLDRILGIGNKLKPCSGFSQTQPVGNHPVCTYTARPYQFQGGCVVRRAGGVGGSERYLIAPEEVIYRDGNGNAGLCWCEEEDSAATFH